MRKTVEKAFFAQSAKTRSESTSVGFKTKNAPYWVPNHAERRVYHPQLVAVYHQGIRLVYHHAFACIEATRVFADGENLHACRLRASSTRSARQNRTGFCAERKNPIRRRSNGFKTKNAPYWVRFCFGAATRIRTGDLILTKDVLYQLSHSSVLYASVTDVLYYNKSVGVCQ